MDDIGIVITGDRKVELKFDEFPKQAGDSILVRIRLQTARLFAEIRAAAPKGKTGKLASDVSQQVYDDRPTSISGRVFVDDDFAKAGALEWGAPGKRPRDLVKAHRAQLDHVFATKLGAPITVTIAEHRRQLHIKAAKYLRGPLAHDSSKIIAELQESVDGAAEADT